MKIKMTAVFQRWLEGLKDFQAVELIRDRIERIKEGHLGDVKNIRGAKGFMKCVYLSAADIGFILSETVM